MTLLNRSGRQREAGAARHGKPMRNEYTPF
jgi:hypothetical protein